MANTWTLAFNARGPAGLSILSGNGAPTGTAAEGQVYINTQTADVYRYTSGAWVKTINLVGPMGLSGINGSFYSGMGAPTRATFDGPGQAIYIQASGEVWLYKNTTEGWVDSGQTLIGPKGDPGAAGASVRGSQIYEGAGPPPDPSTLTPTPAARDLWLNTTNGDFYTFS